MNNNFLKFRLKNLAIILLMAIFFVIDRYLKMLALEKIEQKPLHLIGNLLSFNFTANYNMAFSLPLGGQILNMLVIIVIVLLLYYIFYLTLNKSEHRIFIVPLTIILIGAISNVLDRVTCGYVIDYLDLRYFTVFNLADVMISLGALFIVIKAIKQ